MNPQEYIYRQHKMSRLALSFGIASVIFNFMLMPYIAIPLGCFAILFAALSRGNSLSFSKEGWIALIAGLAGVIIACSMFVKVYNALTTNEQYRNDILQYAETLYGDQYEELYGESLSDIMERLFPERSN